MLSQLSSMRLVTLIRTVRVTISSLTARKLAPAITSCGSVKLFNETESY